MSAREMVQSALVDWLRDTRRFTAPYGILTGIHSDARGRKSRQVTFGVARVSDVTATIYSPRFIVLRDSRFGTVKLASIGAVIAELRRNYSIEEAV